MIGDTPAPAIPAAIASANSAEGRPPPLCSAAELATGRPCRPSDPPPSRCPSGAVSAARAANGTPGTRESCRTGSDRQPPRPARDLLAVPPSSSGGVKDVLLLLGNGAARRPRPAARPRSFEEFERDREPTGGGSGGSTGSGGSAGSGGGGAFAETIRFRPGRNRILDARPVPSARLGRAGGGGAAAGRGGRAGAGARGRTGSWGRRRRRSGRNASMGRGVGHRHPQGQAAPPAREESSAAKSGDEDDMMMNRRPGLGFLVRQAPAGLHETAA